MRSSSARAPPSSALGGPVNPPPPVLTANSHPAVVANGYSSSDEEDERARLQPTGNGGGGSGGTAAGNGISGVADGLNGKRRRRQYSSGSPNESDNTYAEANLLTGSNARYEDYDSEIYANGEPLSVGSSSNEMMSVHHRGFHHQQQKHRSPPEDSRSHGPRYAPLIGSSRHQHDKSPFMSSSSNSSGRTNNGGGGGGGRSSSTTASNGGIGVGHNNSRRGHHTMSPAELALVGRRGQLVLSERGWEQVGVASSSPAAAAGTMAGYTDTRLGRESRWRIGRVR